MSARVDILNIFLILLSGVLAVLFPLELFLLSYVILGPLHYLTEINWLDSKSYFFTSNRKIWLLIGLGASILIVGPKLIMEFLPVESNLRNAVQSLNEWTNAFIFLTLCAAFAYQFIKNKLGWILVGAFVLLGALMLNGYDHYSVIIGLFIPTIIHVYLFTLLFMLYGAKKAKSKFGYLAVLTAILVPLSFIYIQLDGIHYLFPDVLKQVYLNNNFHVTPVLFSKYLGISDGTTFFFYESMEIRLMMFMSFIYLYHYLNWFSKTSIIKWHKNLTSKKTVLIFIIWITILALFYINFRLGFLIALFFSFLHVILEFPLNALSIKGLFNGQEIDNNQTTKQ